MNTVPTRRLRPWRRWLVLGVALATVLTAAPAVADTSAGTRATAGPEGGLRLRLPHAQKPSRSHTPADRAYAKDGNCASIRQLAAESARRGDRTVACFTPVAPPARPAAAGRAVWCEAAPGGWEITRRDACSITGVRWRFYDSQTLIETGRAAFTLRQEITTVEDPDHPHWTEYVSMTMVFAEGSALEGGQAEITLDCPAPCLMSNTSAWGGRRTIRLGETLEGSFDNADYPIPGPDSISMRYSAFFAVPGSISSQFRWRSPTLRCDSIVGINAGCVWPDFIPTLELPVSDYREAALTVAFGNYYLTAGYGFLTPLTRLGDPVQAERNRNVICDRTFAKVYADDTCDEFAFASTHQSGAMLGVQSGIECAELLFELVNGEWWIYPVREILGTENCVRGHVPGNVNFGVGGALGIFTSQQRLLPGDAYWAFAV